MNESIIKRINKAGSPHLLAFFRIAIGLYTVYLTRSFHWEYLDILHRPLINKTIFPAFVDAFIVNNILLIVNITFYISIFFTVGLFTRISAILLFVFYLMMMSFHFMNGGHTQWPYFWFTILILSFSPCADKLSIDMLFKIGGTNRIKELQNYRWPLEIVTLWFALIYFSAGLAKCLPFENTLVWIQGGTIQKILYNRFLYSPLYYIFGIPLFDYSNGNSIFLILLSVMTIILELGAIILLFTRKFHLLIFVSLIFMHFFIYMIGVGDFTIPATVLAITLINPEFINKFFKVKEGL